MPASQPANFNLQEFTDAGQLLVGGRLYTYAYGTTAQKTAFTDPAGTVPHTYTNDGTGGQYIALNARGELPAPLYLGTGSYDIALKRADGSTVWTRKADGVENSVKSLIDSLSASLGAGLLGVIQVGAGAVLRSVLDKLRETVSVTDFGAKCDGLTDDTAAVVKANAAAGKRALIFPAPTLIATATTITAVIADTSAQIFTSASLVTIDNGRKVRPEWWGAKPDGVTESLPAITAALTAAKRAPVRLSAGTGYRTNGKIPLAGRQKLYGAGSESTFILCYGVDAGLQGDQGLADYCEAKGFSIVNKGAPATQIGLDIGTVRNSKFRDIYVKDFLVAVALRKNVDPVGNYYNTLINVVADCGAAPVGSIAFQLGNSIAGNTNREGNANDLYGCRSYGAQTGLAIIGTGNTIKGHKIVSCTYAIAMLEGYDNRVEAYCESQVGDNLGSAAAGTVGNYLDLFNDALNMTRFVDNGWNMISGNVQAGGTGYPSPFRILDCALTDHINVQGKVGATIPVFSVKLPERDGAVRAVVTLSGYTFTAGTWSGVQQWSAYKKASGTPLFNLDNTLGDNRFTVAAAADGTLTWSIAGDLGPTIFTTVQVTVSLQGTSADTTGLGAKILYRRLV